MKTKLFCSFVALFVASVSIFAQTLDGLTCETAIPVDKSFEGTIPAAGTYYYSAFTYDLPMTCNFYPEVSGVKTPEVLVDFTCTPGYYNDPNLAELLSSIQESGMQIPIPFSFQKLNDSENGEYFALTIDESYREILSNFTITYDLQAFIQLSAPCAGAIKMEHDTVFRDCIESAEWISMPDTLVTGVEYKDEIYALPFAEWQLDSIRFNWMGVQNPITIWIGKTCDFELNVNVENGALDMFVLYPNEGNEENIRNFTRKEIGDFISNHGNGGVYYMRALTAENAELVIEKKPMSEEMKKAIRMEMDKSVNIDPENPKQVYYFPKTWLSDNLRWTSSSYKGLQMFWSDYVIFDADSNNSHVFYDANYQATASGREKCLSVKQLGNIDYSSVDEYVFVKFIAEERTTVIPSLWSVGFCAEKADEIVLNETVNLVRNSKSTAWRINAEQWAQQDVKLYWQGTGSIKMYITDTCAGFVLSNTNPHVKYYKEVKVNGDGTRDTLTITKVELENLMQYADADGFLYFRFDNRATGNLDVVADVLEPVIPTPTSPCVENSIELKANVPLTLNLDSAFTVYRINYSEWVTTGATLTWNGTEPLHTFVAETCEFAVAPYNKYVHAYVSVPAEGSAVLDAAKLAEMAAYVDDAGYLYIRFLTEKEGVLEVK